MRKPTLLLQIAATCAIILALSAARSFAAGPTTAPVPTDKATEISSYVLASDDFVTRDKDSKDAIAYAYSDKPIAARLANLGLKFPDTYSAPQGALYILVVSDNLNEKFEMVSGIQSKKWLIVDLAKDPESKPPDKPAENKKVSRVILIICPPLKPINGISLQTSDAVRHSVETTDLGKAK